MLRTRLAVAALVAPALFATAPATADGRLLDGCYGVGVVVCDPYTSGSPVDYDYLPVPVCAGSCQTVNVPVPGLSDDDICVGWTDQAGNETERCLRPRSESD